MHQFVQPFTYHWAFCMFPILFHYKESCSKHSQTSFHEDAVFLSLREVPGSVIVGTYNPLPLPKKRRNDVSTYNFFFFID